MRTVAIFAAGSAALLLIPVPPTRACPASSQNQFVPLGVAGKHIVLLQVTGRRSLDRKWMKGKSKRQRRRYRWGAPMVWQLRAWLRLLDRKGTLANKRISVGKLQVREKRLAASLRRLAHLGVKAAKRQRGFRAGARLWKVSCRWTRS